MKPVYKIFLILLSMFSYSTLRAQVDSARLGKDSVMESFIDPTADFFQHGEKAASPARVSLVTKAGKTLSLAAFLKSLGPNSDHVLADLDNDGKNELLVYDFTGGPHCCDRINIFRNIAPNKYRHVANLFAGNTTITPTREFIYDFYEQFGYFFTCFTCAYPDTTDEGPVPTSNIVLKYNTGKMQGVPPEKELRSIINDNLGKLGEQPYEKLDSASSFDNGLRKEFALNLAVYYYSYGRNMIEIQKLFNKYYKFPDAKKVWAAFVQNMLSLRKQNDF